jgi:hypothetical protein
MWRSGTFLQNEDGTILGSDITEVNGEPQCADCEAATYENELPKPINIYTLPFFPFPVLMLDTSTVEGRATSLQTFAKDGSFSDYRLYEYVVSCFQ